MLKQPNNIFQIVNWNLLNFPAPCDSIAFTYTFVFVSLTLSHCPSLHLIPTICTIKLRIVELLSFQDNQNYDCDFTFGLFSFGAVVSFKWAIHQVLVTDIMYKNTVCEQPLYTRLLTNKILCYATIACKTEWGYNPLLPYIEYNDYINRDCFKAYIRLLSSSPKPVNESIFQFRYPKSGYRS